MRCLHTRDTARLAELLRADDEAPDDVLAAQAQQDPRQFAALYSRYFAGIYGYCFSELGDSRNGAADAAEPDLPAEALGALDRYRADNRFRSWLFTIARNVLRDARRREHPDHANRERDGTGRSRRHGRRSTRGSRLEVEQLDAALAPGSQTRTGACWRCDAPGCGDIRHRRGARDQPCRGPAAPGPRARSSCDWPWRPRWTGTPMRRPMISRDRQRPDALDQYWDAVQAGLTPELPRVLHASDAKLIAALDASHAAPGLDQARAQARGPAFLSQHPEAPMSPTEERRRTAAVLRCGSRSSILTPADQRVSPNIFPAVVPPILDFDGDPAHRDLRPEAGALMRAAFQPSGTSPEPLAAVMDAPTRTPAAAPPLLRVVLPGWRSCERPRPFPPRQTTHQVMHRASISCASP